MIERAIHQVWIGPKEVPDDVQKYVDSTKAINRGWDHHFWGNSSLDLYKNDPYIHHMIKGGEKWAFVADRLRILLLRDFGGVYIDADAMPLKPLDSMSVWNNPAIDFVASFRDPYRPGVALHRGISLIDNTFMASAKDGRMINRLVRLYNSRTPKRDGHDTGVEIIANCLEDTAFINFRYVYGMEAHPESVFLHDPINLGSWVDTHNMRFANA
jgi:hypothetical protein